MLLRVIAPLALALCSLAATAAAQVKSMDLPEMVSVADQAVHGRILSKRVARIDAPDGRTLYYTTMTVEGRLLDAGTPVRVDVTFSGGFLNEEEGYWHSEAPSADDTRVGNDVVLFTKWTDGMGGALRANWIVAEHGGLFRTVDGPDGPLALGRGQGYAIAKNVRVADLSKAVERIKIEQAQKRSR